MRDSHYVMWLRFGSGSQGAEWSLEELEKINRKYCEDTGRWELFNWK